MPRWAGESPQSFNYPKRNAIACPYSSMKPFVHLPDECQQAERTVTAVPPSTWPPPRLWIKGTLQEPPMALQWIASSL
ncbi:unnamed protein product [Mesocestoides corti]|uniref:Uncharacterized protein n=1 Tax=Mesocestoides corti TaxID=53468 RepID=A0A0R3UFF2_MESCO|nr:unnamed protein product [Mesocestoides corti]